MRFILFLLISLSAYSVSAEKFVAISKHMLLTDEGNVYSMDTGYDEKGPWGGYGKELYLGRDSKDFLGKVEFLSDIKKIIVADGAFLALNFNDELFVWGSGGYEFYKEKTCSGLLLGKDINVLYQPVEVRLDQPIKEISYSGCIVTLIDQVGTLYKWGMVGTIENGYFKRPPYFYNTNEAQSVSYFIKPVKVLPKFKFTKANWLFAVQQKNKLFRFVKKPDSRFSNCLGNLCEIKKYKGSLILSDYGEVALDDGTVLTPAFGEEGDAGKVFQEMGGFDCIQALSDRSFLTCSGDVYRWGRVASYYDFFTALVSGGQPKSIFPSSPYKIDRHKGVVHFERDAFVTDKGEVYIYGASESLYSSKQLYRAALSTVYDSRLFQEKEFQIKYHKILDSNWLRD